MFPDGSVAAAGAGCRNPVSDVFNSAASADPDGPWCFTTSSEAEWEYCFDLPQCDCKIRALQCQC